MNIAETFRSFSRYSAAALGSPWVFVVNVLLILLWLFSGPFFNYSDTWQLIVNTATTVFTYLAVFLIQNTQNRDAVAIHLKLDELILSLKGPRNELVSLEDLSEEEVKRFEQQFKRLRERMDEQSAGAKEAMPTKP